MGKKTWTEEEEKILREYYPKMYLKDIAKLLPRHSKSGIVQKAKKLGLTKKHKLLFGCPWSEKEIEILREYYPRMSVREIHRKFLPHRSVYAIKEKIRKLELTGAKTLAEAKFKRELKELTPLQWSYIAGLIDGEGTITIDLNKPRDFPRKMLLTPDISISNVSKELITWLQKTLGIKSYLVIRRKTDKRGIVSRKPQSVILSLIHI